MMQVMKYMRNIASAGLIILIFTSCSQEPVEIHIHSDQCAHCKMMISDERFATQVISPKGKAVTFDAIECMVSWQKEQADTDGYQAWVSDYNKGGSWIKASQAIYVKSEVVSSPMGASLLSFNSKEEALEHLSEYPGQIVDYYSLGDRVVGMSSGHSMEMGVSHAK